MVSELELGQLLVSTYRLVREGQRGKGNVLGIARTKFQRNKNTAIQEKDIVNIQYV